MTRVFSFCREMARQCLCAGLIFCALVAPGFAQSDDYRSALSAYQTQNFAEAESIWVQLAQQGDANAEYALGVMHLRGEAADATRSRAFEYFSSAADQGHGTAMFNVGVAYWEGSGVAQDKELALDWWERSARQGDSGAQFNLGLAYYIGEGKSRDLPQAAKWIGLAAEQNHPEAKRILDVIAEENPEIAASNSRPTSETNDDSTPPLPEDNSPTSEPQPEIISQDVDTEQPAATEPVPAAPEVDAPADSVATATENEVNEDPLLDYWKVADTPVALHAIADDDSPVVLTLPAGTPVTVIGNDSGWSRITLPPGLKLWIYSKFIDVSGNEGVVNATDVRARPKPMTDNSVAPPIGNYRKGDRVVILDRQGDWHQVRAPQHLGAWTRSGNIQRYRDTARNRENLWQSLESRGL